MGWDDCEGKSTYKEYYFETTGAAGDALHRFGEIFVLMHKEG